MLCLARKLNEAVILSIGDVRVRVLVMDYDRKRSKVRLGFEAPPAVTIHREEIQQLVDEGAQQDAQQ